MASSTASPSPRHSLRRGRLARLHRQRRDAAVRDRRGPACTRARAPSTTRSWSPRASATCLCGLLGALPDDRRHRPQRRQRGGRRQDPRFDDAARRLAAGVRQRPAVRPASWCRSPAWPRSWSTPATSSRHVKAVRELLKFGKSEVAIFLVTVAMIVVTDLLDGRADRLALSIVKLLYAFSHLDVAPGGRPRQQPHRRPPQGRRDLHPAAASWPRRWRRSRPTGSCTSTWTSSTTSTMPAWTCANWEQQHGRPAAASSSNGTSSRGSITTGTSGSCASRPDRSRAGVSIAPLRKQQGLNEVLFADPPISGRDPPVVPGPPDHPLPSRGDRLRQGRLPRRPASPLQDPLRPSVLQ